MRICLFCEHFEFDPGSPGWSEWTPGYPSSVGCKKDRWGPSFEDYGFDLRTAMVTAETCPEWTVCDFAAERGVT